MKAEQVDKALLQKFITEGERLVFWHDTNAEFIDYVMPGLSGDLADVQVLHVAELGGLSTKLRLEKEDRSGKYLVYSQGEMPDAEEDWLLDIRLYSAQFHADVASLWLQELGLTQLSLRTHLHARSKFLASQPRRKKLARLLTPTDDAVAIDLKMMAVLVNSPVASPFNILIALCDGHLTDSGFDLSNPPKIIQTFEKMDLLDAFWKCMHSEFSYTAEAPSVSGLLRRLFASELFHQTDGASMESLAHYQLPEVGRRNAVVFLTQWRDSSLKAISYEAAAAAIAVEQKIREPLSNLDLDTVKEVFTFWEAERCVVSSLKERLLSEIQTVDVDSIAEIASQRKAGHWLSGPGRDQPERRAIASAFDAIVAAAELFSLRAVHQHALTFDKPADLLAAYQKDLYRFDQLYRSFCANSKPARSQGWDLLKTLAIEVEQVYDQGFLQPLGVEWSRHLDAGFLNEWSLDGLPAQQNFYADQVTPHLAKAERNRAFVIISDAFRYEAAQKLTEALNGTYRTNATLTGMLGVLPSYTSLGMASLLPHQSLTYSDKGDVLVDGQSTSSTDARSKQLATVQGMACQATDLNVMTQDAARAFTNDTRVVYIYHNVIDARGDSASTEGETFEAVSDCIKELVDLVQLCTNKLNAGKVWVTADHGFLYQQKAPSETDKSKLSHKPTHAVKSKKRYVIGHDLGTSPEAHHGSINTTAGATGGMEFWIPRSTNRFHFAGGARFIHGGAMPQEALVPVVTISVVRDKKAEGTRAGNVSVQVLGNNHKITTPTYRFEFIQTEAVSERKKPITLRAAILEGANPVTAIETVTFDSDSSNIDERKQSIRIKLRTGTFNKQTPYRLVLRDAETDAEVQSIPVIIDRSFDDDF